METLTDLLKNVEERGGGGNSGLKMILSSYMTVSSRLIKKNIIYNARREKSVIEITKTRFSY